MGGKPFPAGYPLRVSCDKKAKENFFSTINTGGNIISEALLSLLRPCYKDEKLLIFLSS